MLHASIYPQVIPAEAVEESAADCHFDSVSQAHGKSKKRKQDRDGEGAERGKDHTKQTNSAHLWQSGKRFLPAITEDQQFYPGEHANLTYKPGKKQC